MEFGGGLANFAYPMPHLGRRVDVDALWVSGPQQPAIVLDDCHCNKAVMAIAITSKAGTTTGGPNQASI